MHWTAGGWLGPGGSGCGGVRRGCPGGLAGFLASLEVAGHADAGKVPLRRPDAGLGPVDEQGRDGFGVVVVAED